MFSLEKSKKFSPHAPPPVGAHCSFLSTLIVSLPYTVTVSSGGMAKIADSLLARQHREISPLTVSGSCVIQKGVNFNLNINDDGLLGFKRPYLCLSNLEIELKQLQTMLPSFHGGPCVT